MATRLQSIAIGLSSNKQANISTAATPNYNRIRMLSSDPVTLQYNTETDEDEIGKGNEFISIGGVFPTYWDMSYPIKKYASAEFTTWAWAYAMGEIQLASSLYTIHALDPAVALELPYFTVVQQLPDGGGMAIDEAYLGCAVEEVMTTMKYGPGRASATTDCTIMGSGQHTIPSGIVLPTTVQTEKYMLSSSAAVTINGIDYVAGSPGSKTFLSATMSWKNSLLGGLGFHPGSGIVSGAAVRDRLFIGKRTLALDCTAFLQVDSTEFTKLVAQTTGTAVLTLTFDATHFVTWSFPSVSFRSVTRGQEEGIAVVHFSAAAQFDPTVVSSLANGPLVITAKCADAFIGQ